MTSEILGWKIHTSGLFEEILLNNPSCVIFKSPLFIMRGLMAKVAQRAIELNDPQLNTLMIRLTLYSIADPKSPDYDPQEVNNYLSGVPSPTPLEATK